MDRCAVFFWDGAEESEAATIFGKVKEEVKNIAKFRGAMLTPQPVQVDRVKTDRWNDEAKETENDEGGEP